MTLSYLMPENAIVSLIRGYDGKCPEVWYAALSAAEDAMRDHHSEPLSLTEAASECGYSATHLGRLVKGEDIPNAGRPNAPKIRRCDLPRKPGMGMASKAIGRSRPT